MKGLNKIIKTTGALLMAALLLFGGFHVGSYSGEASAEPADQGLTAVKGSAADDIIVQRAMRLAFLGDPEGLYTWIPRYSFYACNSTKRYEAGVAENSLPYSRSALFNTSEFAGMQQYIGCVDADTGATTSYDYSLTYFMRSAAYAGSDFNMAARAAVATGSNWGALLGTDCSGFLSYAWQIPHMTTYMLTSDAVDWHICRQIPATVGHESVYTYADLLALEPGDAMICCRWRGTDDNGNPVYRGHSVLITAIRLDKSGNPAVVETVEEIAPRAIVKIRTADQFLEYVNKLHSSGAYYKFYRLVSKRHLKLEIEITYDVCGGDPWSDEESVAFVFARDAKGSTATYNEVINKRPTREGYVFMGWGLTKDGDDIISPNTPIDLLMDHTLYARWREA
ncbi:MAG: InlB B-repeat-containing protein [Clostridiales bacterium]|nr:InlB B-repeat-containing protein [Clostridiales bacterium]